MPRAGGAGWLMCHVKHCPMLYSFIEWFIRKPLSPFLLFG
jgi:hypothetical protein